MFLARRRKGIFTLFLLASFVIFCTWLMQFKFDDYKNQQENYINSNINKDSHDNIKLELKRNHHHHHERMLLLANTITAEAENQDSDFKLSRLNKLQNEESFENVRKNVIFDYF
jgi:hypothetical protein